ncbi:MAG: phosphoserine phosphatase SerB [Hyphomicrobiaceae bacterium]
MAKEAHTALLLAAPGSQTLTDDLVAGIASALAEPGARTWLAPGEAVEIPMMCHSAERHPLVTMLKSRIGRQEIDVAVVPARNRRKKLLIADMDSTLIGQECIDELAEIAGRRAEVAAITERSMRGEIDFKSSLTERVGLLRGLPEKVLGRVAESRITLNPGAMALSSTMRRHGATTVIVSGGFTVFTAHVRARAGFDRDQANRLEVIDGQLTGRLIPPILDRDAKAQTLTEIASELGIEPADVIAVGDGANDIGMIRAAGLGVAYRGKPILRAAADVEIDHATLTALLYLQGYRVSEISE